MMNWLSHPLDPYVAGESTLNPEVFTLIVVLTGFASQYAMQFRFEQVNPLGHTPFVPDSQ
jgi:hypothetical protein